MFAWLDTDWLVDRPADESWAELHPRPNHRGRRGFPLPFHQTEQEVHHLAGVLQGVGGVRLLGALGHKDPDALAPLPQHLMPCHARRGVISISLRAQKAQQIYIEHSRNRREIQHRQMIPWKHPRRCGRHRCTPGGRRCSWRILERETAKNRRCVISYDLFWTGVWYASTT